jgi:hypothetical protein
MVWVQMLRHTPTCMEFFRFEKEDYPLSTSL